MGAAGTPNFFQLPQYANRVPLARYGSRYSARTKRLSQPITPAPDYAYDCASLVGHHRLRLRLMRLAVDKAMQPEDVRARGMGRQRGLVGRHRLWVAELGKPGKGT